MNEEFTDINDLIIAYFSLAIKIFKIYKPTKTKRKKLQGSKDLSHDYFYAFLIGQIGRNDSYSKEEIDGDKIFDYIYGILKIVHKHIGGRIILIECDNKRLKEYYNSKGFNDLQEIIKDKITYYQLIKTIKKIY